MKIPGRTARSTLTYGEISASRTRKVPGIALCIKCGHNIVSVTDTRAAFDTIRRRRACHACKARWTTWEVTDDVINVLKNVSHLNIVADEMVRMLESGPVNLPLAQGIGHLLGVLSRWGYVEYIDRKPNGIATRIKITERGRDALLRHFPVRNPIIQSIDKPRPALGRFPYNDLTMSQVELAIAFAKAHGREFLLEGWGHIMDKHEAVRFLERNFHRFRDEGEEQA